ncbi:ABC transporter permease [Marinobacterium mangrovicola]|uniref:Putative ABC transport system permease protein n=1 Tax=Marinobacterium mangrovicola TaxID=1476959 RepID=A0A4R1GNQ6_9GAMM|nr:FtsX-like permease family protein [Marinobacterium mangrovicola]TCK06072.1 putative ABC transport system permease protein [Marinobacterium mangrovicola]
MNLLPRLALRQLKTQLRTTEWRALLLATLIAITLTTLLTLLGDRLERGLLRESANLLGADLVLSSGRPLSDERLQEIAANDVTSTQVVQFPSMVSNPDAGEETPPMLVSVRAADPPYPLRGEIITEPAHTSDLPASGHVWIEARVMNQLGLEIGDRLQLGYSEFTVSAELISSPDRGTGFRSFSPHIIIDRADLEATGVLAPGSRASFRVLMSGDKEEIAALDAQLRPTLADYERLLALQTDQPVTGNALGNALAYLKLSALTALLLSALTILLSLRRFSQKQFTRSALLLNLGLNPAQLVRVYLYQLLFAWGLLAIIGTAIAALVDGLVQSWLINLLPQRLPEPAFYTWFSGAALGLVMLILLGLPPVLSLARIPVAHLLRGDTPPQDKRARVLQASCLVILAVTLLLFLQAPAAALILLGLLVIGGLVFGYIAQFLLEKLAEPMAGKLLLGRLLRLRLRQQRKWHRLQSAVIVLLLTLLAVVWVSRADLLSEWRAKFPTDTPNFFVINIQPWQKPDLDGFLQDNEIDSTLYPMIRGRLNELNGEPIRPQLTEEQLQDNTLRRELNLSWTRDRPEHNELLAGQWWETTPDRPQISVEQDMMEDLGLELGDSLGFDIGGQQVSAEITSIRGVEWTSFRPNFYVIFSPGALENYPGTWITSFRLEGERKQLATEMLRDFPSLTLIDIDQLLAQLGTWLKRLGDSSAMILALTLLCGLILMAVTLLQALEQRRFESALMQTLGASGEQTRRLDLLEFLLLGLVCGVLAGVASEITLAGLHVQLLDVEPKLHPWLWISLPALASLFFVATGFLIRRPLRLDQCYRLLRSQS